MFLHTKVRWISKGNSVQRLVELFESTIEIQCESHPLSKELQYYKGHLFYMADLYTKLNEVQKKLQGKIITMIQARTGLFAFQRMLGLHKYSLGHGKFLYF